jgi:hypothetical protein
MLTVGSALRMNKLQSSSGCSELGVTYIYKQMLFNTLSMFSSHVYGVTLRGV